MNQKNLLTIIVPAYNEEKRIGASLKKILLYLDEKRFLSEVIVINDGSYDNTRSVVEAIKDKRLSIVDNEKNMGKGYSVKRGIKEASGDFIIFSDADLSTPIEEADKLLDYLQEDYDFVIGSRYVAGSHIKVKQPLHRQLMGRVFNLFVRLVAVPHIKDTQCGFKGFRRDCAGRVFDMVDTCGYSFDVEVIYVAYKLGMKMKEVPIVWIDSPSSRINPFIDPLKMFFEVLKIVWKYRNKKFSY